MVQWLGLRDFSAEGAGSIPGRGTKIAQDSRKAQIKKKRKLQQFRPKETKTQALKKAEEGFPGGTVVENLPADAGDMGSSPGLGRSHMPRSNWDCEPQLLSLRVWSLCSATREAATVRGPSTAMKSGPCLPQLEKALAQKRRPNTAKKKKSGRKHLKN